MSIVDKPWEKHEVPWCTVCLVTFIVICHSIVLFGNMSTAGALNGIGTSTSKWSNVGLDVSLAFRTELDEIMKNVTEKVTDSIGQVLHIQELLDLIVGLVGGTVDNVTESNATKAMLLLQSHRIRHVTGQHCATGQCQVDAPVGGIGGIISGTVDQIIDQLMVKVHEGLHKLMEIIKPALEQVGAMITKFGDKVQDMLESFSVTLDKAQKIFDQVMASISGSGGSYDDLFYNTFSLFDFSNTGAVSADDLSLVAQTYKISALEGSKSEQLVKKFDKDESGDLDKHEFTELTGDDSVPDIMSVVLRSFSEKLSEISGTLEQSKFRDDVAQNVVSYLQLMGAKNMTKVGWVCQRLTNASLPMSFTSDVLVNLALQKDDPNAMSTADIGLVVMTTMLTIETGYTMACVDHISDPEYWSTEGYDPEDQPVVVERVTDWLTEGMKEIPVDQVTEALAKGTQDYMDAEAERQAEAEAEPDSEAEPNATNETDLDAEATTSEEEPVLLLEQEVIEAMPMIAKRIATRNMKAHVTSLRTAKQATYNKLFASKTSQKMLLHLMGGVHAADTSSASSPAERATKSGVPAVPATLEFAKFLSWNASATSQRFSGYCFSNSGTSSNAIDGFAQDIQGMVKKIQAFIEQMEKYSTPEGIKEIEEKVEGFLDQGLTDITKVVKKTLDDLMEDNLPALDDAVNQAIYDAGDDLGHMIGGILGTPLGDALSPVVSEILGKLVGDSSDAADELSETLSGMVGDTVSEVAGDKLGEILGDALENIAEKALEDASGTLSDALGASLLEVPVNKSLGQQRLLHVKQKNMTTPDAKDVELFKQKLNKAVQHAEMAVQFAVAEKKGEVADHHALRINMKELQRNLHDDRLTRVRTAASNCSVGGRSVGGQCPWSAKVSLFATYDQELADEDPDETSDVWPTLVQMLKTFSNVLPLATSNLKFARKAVSSLAKNLDSIFIMLDDMGSPIFEDIAGLWRTVFICYWCFMAILPTTLLFYGFWAGGYFGGPGNPPLPAEVEEDLEEKYSGFCGKLHRCCDSCCWCIREYHDTTCCFWTFLIFLEIFGLILFVMALVFALLTGIKMFLAAGCASVYILGDEAICGSTLLSLREFLSSFMGHLEPEAFEDHCSKEHLLLCDMIGDKMKMSGLLTVIGAFMAALLTAQLLIESATLHTRAVERRRYAYMFIDKEIEKKEEPPKLTDKKQ